MKNTLRELSTHEAQAKIRAQERKYATQTNWRRSNAQFQQIYKNYRAKFTRHR